VMGCGQLPPVALSEPPGVVLPGVG
jgi:hypothetical protein